MIDQCYETELYHHGVKGQKWGIRRYQYADGSLTPTGKKRQAANNSKGIKKTAYVMSMKVSDLNKKIKMTVTGRQYVDTYLKKETKFSRIQSSKDFENFAFYATYKKHDIDKYTGLFGKNLKDRASNDAKVAEKKAKETGNKTDISEAKALRDRADNMKIYQLKIESTKKLKVPSDENAGHITAKLLKEPDFKKNVEA